MKYFIDTMGPRDYLGSMVDHGGNATPVWLLSAWVIYRNLPANEWTLSAVSFIDPVLLLIFFVVLARTFGLRVMLYTVVLFGATDFYQFGSNLMGSTLRQDWLVALGLGACALKKNRPFLGGFLLAYGGLIRAFPAMAALFLLVPVGVFIADCLIQRRATAEPARADQPARAQTLRAIAGAALAVVGLVLLTSGVFGYKQGWGTWFTKIEMHAVGPSTNNVGLRNLLAYRPADTARALARRQANNPWDQWDQKAGAQLRPAAAAVLRDQLAGLRPVDPGGGAPAAVPDHLAGPAAGAIFLLSFELLLPLRVPAADGGGRGWRGHPARTGGANATGCSAW